MKDGGAPLTGWALDPIYFDNQRMTRQDLDRVSKDRPIGVLHASCHITNVNSKALEMAGLLRPGINHPGVPLGPDGLPTGELKGPEAMTIVGAHVGLDREFLAADEQGLRDFARLCVRMGVTTAADLANLLPPAAVDMMKRVTAEARFPARIVSLRVARELAPKDLIRTCRRTEGAYERSPAPRHGENRRRRVDPGPSRPVSGRPATSTARLTVSGMSRRRNSPRSSRGRSRPAFTCTRTPTATKRRNSCSTPMDAALKKHPSRDHRFTLQHCQLGRTRRSFVA